MSRIFVGTRKEVMAEATMRARVTGRRQVVKVSRLLPKAYGADEWHFWTIEEVEAPGLTAIPRYW